MALGLVRPKAPGKQPRLRRLEASVAELQQRASSPKVGKAFKALADDEERQERLARAFGINIWKLDATATLPRLCGLWKLLCDDPFPRS